MEVTMSVRTRGFLILLASALGGGVLFWSRSGILLKGAAEGGAIGGVLQWALTLPLIGVAVGLIELTTGLPLTRADEGWQKLPAYVKYPGALIGSVLFLWAFLWIVAKALGA
jgi:hypothetical protein